MFPIPRDQLEVLVRLARQGLTIRVARRAWVILESSRGSRVDHLSKATPLSSLTVQTLAKRFREMGPLILADAPRSGRPRSADPAQLVGTVTSTGRPASAAEIAQASGVGRGAVWRARRQYVGDGWQDARLASPGGGRRRHRVQELPIAGDDALWNIVAVALAEGACLVATQDRAAQRQNLSSQGIWISPDREVKEALYRAGLKRPDWTRVLGFVARGDPRTPERVVVEQRAPFCRLVRSVAETAPGLDLHLLSGADDRCLLKWLGALRATGCHPAEDRNILALHYASSNESIASAAKRLFGGALGGAVVKAIRRGAGTFFWVRSAMEDVSEQSDDDDGVAGYGA